MSSSARRARLASPAVDQLGWFSPLDWNCHELDAAKCRSRIALKKSGRTSQIMKWKHDGCCSGVVAVLSHPAEILGIPTGLGMWRTPTSPGTWPPRPMFPSSEGDSPARNISINHDSYWVMKLSDYFIDHVFPSDAERQRSVMVDRTNLFGLVYIYSD